MNIMIIFIAIGIAVAIGIGIALTQNPSITGYDFEKIILDYDCKTVLVMTEDEFQDATIEQRNALVALSLACVFNSNPSEEEKEKWRQAYLDAKNDNPKPTESNPKPVENNPKPTPEPTPVETKPPIKIDPNALIITIPEGCHFIDVQCPVLDYPSSVDYGTSIVFENKDDREYCIDTNFSEPTVVVPKEKYPTTISSFNDYSFVIRNSNCNDIEGEGSIKLNPMLTGTLSDGTSLDIFLKESIDDVNYKDPYRDATILIKGVAQPVIVPIIPEPFSITLLQRNDDKILEPIFSSNGLVPKSNYYTEIENLHRIKFVADIPYTSTLQLDIGFRDEIAKEIMNVKRSLNDAFETNLYKSSVDNQYWLYEGPGPFSKKINSYYINIFQATNETTGRNYVEFNVGIKPTNNFDTSQSEPYNIIIKQSDKTVLDSTSSITKNVNYQERSPTARTFSDSFTTDRLTFNDPLDITIMIGDETLEFNNVMIP